MKRRHLAAIFIIPTESPLVTLPLCPTFRCFSIISFYFHYLISSSFPPPAFCYHVFLLENLKIFLLRLKFTLWLHYFTIGTLERIEPNGKVEGKLKVYFGKAIFAL